ncbi:hypothetical protein EMIHUDRAFT_431902 [Emiliania huxleyi CCMP1516]|uniref:non-specific serine/threonine protein kinase n=2 Tax=Emiliania huxleyi TaxID=2903 RepID=A0A0D3L1X9_EMIH1|nr:hypothetical protein EMIHUDRAFT_431902 [Emiliania huxleyi CCMP1516]EOD42014.1 hypothetical protein EMIHUDRAFT_431902 [Emiliania huxleyi CCMP1516]|eukprot:XP_005794443.1 hypothetical protein EMIHUDRAFT_431902 [Emiliania huxleyi CCMP1516]
MSAYGPLAMVADVLSGIYAWVTSLCCAVTCSTQSMQVNERNLRVVKLLAEGGFSFVYLVEDDEKKKYALKKVLAQLPEASELARWEVQVHQSFKHANLMPLIDHAVVSTASGAEEFRLLMPLYPDGTLLDLAVRLMEGGKRLEEGRALHLFAQVCEGVLALHSHSPPWAHRDIKPANILLSEGDVPVLMDFGSVASARRHISNRTEALLLQEDAAQNCSMPYRAPELFDTPSQGDIDERTDVFSLGATLYAMAFCRSPFECTFQDNVQRVVECSHLRVIAPAQFPSSHPYSAPFVGLIEAMLTVDASKRPFVPEVLRRVRSMQQAVIDF